MGWNDHHPFLWDHPDPGEALREQADYRRQEEKDNPVNDLPGRGDVNPYGIPVPNPHEQEGLDEDDRWVCPTCGENPAPVNQRCERCTREIEEDEFNRGR